MGTLVIKSSNGHKKYDTDAFEGNFLVTSDRVSLKKYQGRPVLVIDRD